MLTAALLAFPVFASVIIVIGGGGPKTPTTPPPGPNRPSQLSGATINIIPTWSVDGLTTWQTGDLMIEPDQSPYVKLDQEWLSPKPSNASELTEVRWYLGDKRIWDLNHWLRSAGNSRFGVLRAELWEHRVGKYSASYEGTWYWDPAPVLLATALWKVDVRTALPRPADQPPTFIRVPQAEYVLWPDSPDLTLEAEATASESFTYSWSVDRIGVSSMVGPRFPGIKALVLPGGSTTTYYQGRKFVCTASNARGTVQTEVLVRPPHPPWITSYLSYAVRVGGTFAASLTIDSPVPSTWTISGPAGARATVTDAGQVSITDVRFADGGDYVLTGTSAEGVCVRTLKLTTLDYEDVQPLQKGRLITVRTSSNIPVSWQVTPPSYEHGRWRRIDATDAKDFTPLPAMLVNGGYQHALQLHHTKDFLATEYRFECNASSGAASGIIQVVQADEAATLAAFTLPDAMVGAPYLSPPPPSLSASSSGTKYALTRPLPAGLVLVPGTGQITGRPLVAGDFQITFTASNAFGRSRPVTTSLHIQKQPSALAGTYVLWGQHDYSNRDVPYRLDLVIAANGSYTGKLFGRPIKGWVLNPETTTPTIETERLSYHTANQADKASATVFLPATNERVTGRLDNLGVSLAGWKKSVPTPTVAGMAKVKAAAIPAAGRYTFAIDRSVPADPQVHWCEQGTATGTISVSTAGITTVVNQAPPETTVAFLGPQGEVLSLSSQTDVCTELRILADGSITSPVLNVPAGSHKFHSYEIVPYQWALHGFGVASTPAFTAQASGRRWVPPAAKDPVAPYALGSRAPMLEFWIADYTQQTTTWALAANGAGRLLGQSNASGPVQAQTLQINRANGTYSGRLRKGLFNFNHATNLLSFRGVIIQTSADTFRAPGSCEIPSPSFYLESIGVELY